MNPETVDVHITSDGFTKTVKAADGTVLSHRRYRLKGMKIVQPVSGTADDDVTDPHLDVFCEALGDLDDGLLDVCLELSCLEHKEKAS